MASKETHELTRPRFVWGTYAIAALLIYVYERERHALAWGILGSLLDDYAFRWTTFLSDPWRTGPQLITYIFLHGDFWHLAGNLVFLVAFARAVERTIGSLALLGLFLASGAVSALANGYFEPFAPHVIGASGAISGVMGAYFVLFPLQTPTGVTRTVLGRWLRHVPAFVWIGMWLMLQVHSGFRVLLPDPSLGEAASVAYWAHAGGFVFGALAMLPIVFKR